MNRTTSIARSVLLGTSVAALATVIVGLSFVRCHRTSVAVSASEANRQFALLLAQFGGEPPLLDEARRQLAEPASPSQSARPLHSFYTVIFDTRGGQRLVRITVPYWLARGFAGNHGEFEWLGQLTFLDDTEFDPEAIRLPLNQLERHGPGLVAYYRHPGGGRFISWAE
jgi:hypothetical protein